MNKESALESARPVCVSRRRVLAALCALVASPRAAALTESSPRATRRRVLVEVGGEWCTWCHIMDHFFVANPDLAKIRDTSFIVLRVNFSKENQNQAFLARWPKVAGYPHFFVLDANGRLLHSQNTSVLEAAKDYDPAAFRAFLLEWSQR